MNQLKDFAYYVSDKIDVSNLTNANYVGVDNMLPEKQGVQASEYLPTTGTATHFKPGDILIGNIRPYFKKIWLATFSGGCSPDVLCIRPKDMSMSSYLYAVLVQDSFFAYNMLGSKGSKMPRGDKAHIMRYPVPLTEAAEKIGDIAKNLFLAIETNNRIEKQLDEMLALYFGRWFLQFNFPNNDDEPYAEAGGVLKYDSEIGKNIPEEWKTDNIFSPDLCRDIKTGVKYFDKKNYLPTANVNYSRITDGDWISYDNRESRANMEPKRYSVWFAKMKNSVKHISIPSNSDWFIDKYILSTGFQGLQCNKESFAYVHCLINSNWFESYKDKLAHGATQESVNNNDLTNIIIPIPTKDVLEKFSTICNPILEKKFMILKKNQELNSLRDFILPLMTNNKNKE